MCSGGVRWKRCPLGGMTVCSRDRSVLSCLSAPAPASEFTRLAFCPFQPAVVLAPINCTQTAAPQTEVPLTPKPEPEPTADAKPGEDHDQEPAPQEQPATENEEEENKDD